MSVETDNFIVGDVSWNYTQSREITGDRMPRARVKSGLASADLTCKQCGHSWISRKHGVGAFLPYIGGIILDCPECPNEGKLELRLLDSK